MNTLLVIDGNAIMHRAYHALPPFKTKKGVPTNAVYGFFTMLYKAIQDFTPQYIAVGFDTPAQTFRQKIHKKYQSQRPEISDDFKIQIPIIQKLLDKAHIYREEKDGLEADDIIGTIVARSRRKDLKILILTGDKDIMQLIDKNTYVVSPQMGMSTTKIYNIVEVEKKLFVPPSKIPDLKAIAGDPSDNYSGAKGIGPKTAASLLEEYGTLENLLKNVKNMKNPKLKKIFEDQAKDVLLAKKLSQIVTDADISFTLEKASFNGFPEELKEAFTELEMKSLVQRFFNISLSSAPPTPKKQKKDDKQINLF